MYRTSFIFDGDILTECVLSSRDEAFTVGESFAELAGRLVFTPELCDIRVTDLDTYKIIKTF